MFDYTILEKGIEAENHVFGILKDHYTISRKKTRGIDFYIHELDLKLEIKSCSSMVRSKKIGFRRGRFYITPKDLERTDIFAFLIEYKKGVYSEVYYVKVDIVRDFLSKRKTTSEYYPISIIQLKTMLKPKAKLEDLL